MQILCHDYLNPMKHLNRTINLALAALVIFVAVQRAPEIINHFRDEGGSAPSFVVKSITGEKYDSALLKHSMVIVFWATWCGPCEVELGRINKMILNKEIQPSSVLAISSQEKPDVVEKAMKERGYLFPIGLDGSGKIANDFKVSATPTIFFLNDDRRIAWLTTGFSPLLEFRIKRFLKN
jgi:cytochrome c biogenesis protein CcmG/thiol:disulfide interchange protein DsbE